MKEIDNAGGGDCGPYAFSIALIDIIQNEHLNTNESPTFKRWQKEGLQHITLKNILKVDLNESTSKHGDLLFKLQGSIRHIAAESKKNDLLDKIREEKKNPDSNLTLVESTAVFANFLELVDTYIKNESTQKINDKSRYNELALSNSVKKLAETTAETYKSLPVSNDFLSQNIQINSMIKQAIFDDINTGNSLILQGVDVLKKQGQFLTHTDLKHVAGALKVNLVIHGQNNGQIPEDLPTVTLNNKNNRHWTTIINPSIHASIDNRLEMKIKRIIESTASSQADIQKATQYKKNLKSYKKSALTTGFFDRVSNKIDLNNLDEERAFVTKNGEQQSDELFDLALQEAEFRRAGLL